MTVDQRAEIPSGYIPKDLPEIDARILMPETWFYLDHQGFGDRSFVVMMPMSNRWAYLNREDVDTKAFFMTKESIVQDGIFTTGLTLNVVPNFSDKVCPAEDFARDFLQSPHPLIIPVSEMQTEEDGPLVISRRFFIMPVEQTLPIPSFHGGIVVKHSPPSHFYYLTAGNRETDTAYLAFFETPSLKWKDDRKTAEIMINTATFSKIV